MYRTDSASIRLFGKRFSLCEVGSIVGLEPAVLSDDLALLHEAIEAGMAMIEAHTRNA